MAVNASNLLATSAAKLVPVLLRVLSVWLRVGGGMCSGQHMVHIPSHPPHKFILTNLVNSYIKAKFLIFTETVKFILIKIKIKFGINYKLMCSGVMIMAQNKESRVQISV